MIDGGSLGRRIRMDHEAMPAANRFAAGSNGDDRAQGCARVGIDREPKRDLIHPLANANAEGLAAPEGQPVAQKRLLMLPGELERRRAVARVPVGYAEISSELFRFRAPTFLRLLALHCGASRFGN